MPLQVGPIRGRELRRHDEHHCTCADPRPDQGTQFSSWAFTRRALDSRLLPSMGSVGDCFDNAVMESF
jgi:hypothetical protein